MKEQVLNLFKRALTDYEKQIDLSFKDSLYRSGLCYYFTKDTFYTIPRVDYLTIFIIIQKYNPFGCPGLNHFFPKGELTPRIELLQQIIADIEAGKHDDILIEKEVEV
jgi:hypothetical protein